MTFLTSATDDIKQIDTFSNKNNMQILILNLKIINSN